MDLGLPPKLEAFRNDLRAFIAKKAPRIRVRTGFRSPTSDTEKRLLAQWRADLYAAGYLGADWPEEHGGRPDRDPMEDFIVVEELANAGLPPINDQTTLASFAIARFGTPEQQRRFLPAIRSGAETWCQLFSEPDAGSDLANMRTRALLQDDGSYIIDGQKVWSTNAQVSDFGFLIARSDPRATRHHGLSAFALDMRSPGIEVRPLREITGTSDFGEVFFEGVAVPHTAMLGEPGQGWQVALESLGAERTGIGAGAARLRPLLGALLELVRSWESPDGERLVEAGDVRQELARLHAEVEVANLLAYAKLSYERDGVERQQDAPIGKLAFSEVNLELAEVAMSLLGPAGLLVEGDEEAVGLGRWPDELLYARTYTIAGGSSEIMRNVIAERVLGMPREPKPVASAGDRR